MKLKRILVALGLCVSFLAAPAAHADVAGDFLSGLEGKFRGRGMAKILNRDKAEPVSCKVSNSYDAAKSSLQVVGDCASSQGKSKVSGNISHSGDAVSGAFIGNIEGSTVTGSRGSVSAGRLVINSNLVDNATGNLTRTRQVIRKEGAGFVAEFYSYDNKSAKYELNGTMNFTKG